MRALNYTRPFSGGQLYNGLGQHPHVNKLYPCGHMFEHSVVTTSE